MEKSVKMLPMVAVLVATDEPYHTWASADFFPGGQKHTNCLKTPKRYNFSQKSLKHIIFDRTRPARGAKSPL
jgi:hypothetical protein